MFSVQSMPICYKQDNWGNELVVGQLRASKNVSMEAKDIVGVRHRHSRRALVNCRVCELEVVVQLLVVSVWSIIPITNRNPVSNII